MLNNYTDVQWFIESIFRHRTFESNQFIKCSSNHSTSGELIIYSGNAQSPKVIFYLCLKS